jgi:divalent metal cation (Fe/Co/Zn/Cd) transporter
MAQIARIRTEAPTKGHCPEVARVDQSIVRLQIITLCWMLVECAGSILAAERAHSVSLLAFGSDSLVELLSAGLVLLQFTPVFHIGREKAVRLTGGLLYFLAGVVGLIALAAIARHAEAERSLLGISITSCALIVMPILARLKKKRAAETGDKALRADAVQSATCAYLAAITLVTLSVQAISPLRWIDPLGALCALPILVLEGRKARRGESCGCC